MVLYENYLICIFMNINVNLKYAVARGNYRGQKLMEQAMKVIERIADSLIRQVVTIDE